MPSKYRIILEMASQTARNIASNADQYTDFLITAANNYKYSFKEQLLIHAQKPDATACAEIDTWNKLGRWVNKGTKGIALLIDRDVPYKLRHVFDISDTNSRAGRNITLWQMKPEYEYAVSESLQASFGDVEEPRDFPHLLIDISGYELNPPPEPQKEYRYHLGDTVYIGTQEYELLSFDEKKVVLFDTQFPLFNKELSREEFDNRLKENPLNDKLLQVVEEAPAADNTKAKISIITVGDASTPK